MILRMIIDLIVIVALFIGLTLLSHIEVIDIFCQRLTISVHPLFWLKAAIVIGWLCYVMIDYKDRRYKYWHEID